MSAEQEAEAAARIIDPEAFDLIEYYYGHDWKGEPREIDKARAPATLLERQSVALIKARLILSRRAGEGGEGDKLIGEAWGALNFILAFYEPGQRYLDTEAWKNAEAGGRRVHAALREYLDRPKSAPPHPQDSKEEG